MLIPFGLFGIVLLLPTTLVLLAVLPVAVVAALLMLLWRAPVAEPDTAHLHAMPPHGHYST
jgi:hypothetical protein